VFHLPAADVAEGELLPANVNRLLFFEEARSPHKRNFRFGRATFRSYGNIERWEQKSRLSLP